MRLLTKHVCMDVDTAQGREKRIIDHWATVEGMPDHVRLPIPVLMDDEQLHWVVGSTIPLIIKTCS